MKPYSFDLNKGMVTFAMFTKTDANKLFNILKNSIKDIKVNGTTSYALGRTKLDGKIILSVIEYNYATLDAKVLSNIEVDKVRSNNEMKRLIYKYNLLD